MRESSTAEGILTLVALLLFTVTAVALIVLVRRTGRFGKAGRAGGVLGIVGISTLVVASLVQALLYEGDFPLMPYFVIPGIAALVTGLVLLGVSVLRSGVLPRWASIALLLGTAAMIGFNEQTHAAWLGLPFSLAWMAVGYALWTSRVDTAADAHPSGSTRRALGAAAAHDGRRPTRARSSMTMDGTRLAPWSGAAALMAGVLWASHGAFEMLQPLGPVTEYQDHLRYSIITDARGFRLYGLPGPPATLLSAAVIMATVRRGGPGWRRTIATWLAGVAAVLAVAAAVGVAVLLDPPFEAGMNFGRLLVSVAAVVAGGLLRRHGETQRLGTFLQLAGWIGVFVLVARVMVNALEFLPGAAAFGISVVFGFAWVVAGLHMLGVIGARPASHVRHHQTVSRTV